MNIGIMADSHDNVQMIHHAVERLEAEGAECLIHAGDFIAPFAVKAILRFNGRVYGCFGNNDGEKHGISQLWPDVAEPPVSLNVGGLDILLTHDIAAINRTPQAAKAADVVIYGHSHSAAIEEVETDNRTQLRINPGETGGWLRARPTVAILDTDTRQARIVEL